MGKGLGFNPKKRDAPGPRPVDLDSTSGARRYLRQVQKQGTPEQLAAAQKDIAERHPDMLIERRNA